MDKAPILVDIQNDFCENGALAVSDASQILPIALDAIEHFKSNNHHVIATLDWHPANHKSFASNNSGTQVGELGLLNDLPQIWWPDHCIQDTFGSALHIKLPQDQIDFLVYKGQNPEIDSYSAFFDNDKKQPTTLNSYLKKHNISKLTIMGLATDYCVKFSALDAIALGYQVDLLTNGCKGVNLQAIDSEEALQQMKENGVRLIDKLN